MLLAFGAALLQQVLHVDGEQHAVDGLARARFFQERQELIPGAGVNVAVGLLRRVAACGVYQHRILREPPFAIARAAHTLHRSLAATVLQQKLQPGMHQRCGFS